MTTASKQPWERDHEPERSTAEKAVRDLLSGIGYNHDRPGLSDTPARVAKFLTEMCTPESFAFTMFANDSNSSEMVVQTGISFASLCEHHMLPFVGTAVVAYIPSSRIVGLSKLARAVRYCAAGLQTQERITVAVADMLEHNLEPQGVGVVLRARHTCMEVRGVKAQGAETVTSCVRGSLLADEKARAEFMSLAVR